MIGREGLLPGWRRVGWLAALRLLLPLLLAVLLGLLPSVARADDPQPRLLAQGWMESAAAELPRAELERARFTPFERGLALGFGDRYLWLRLRVAPPAGAGEGQQGDPGPGTSWILRIQPAPLDEIALFDPLGAASPDGFAPTRFSGDRHGWAAGGYASTVNGFVLPASAQPRDVYLRIRSTSSRIVRAELLSPAQAERVDLQAMVLQGAAVALFALFAVWGILRWLASPGWLLALFVCKQVVVMAALAMLFGLQKLFLAEELGTVLQDRITTLAVLLYVGSGIAYESAFLRPVATRRWLWRAIVAMAVPWFAGVALFAAGHDRQALQVNAAVMATASILFFAAALSARARSAGAPGRAVLAGFYGVSLLAMAPVGMAAFGGQTLAPFAVSFAVYFVFFNAAPVALLLMLWVRAQEQAEREAAIALELARRQADVERAQREEHQRFLAMLTHELKTPISVAQISLDALEADGPERARIARALRNMDDIVERCRISDEVEGRRLEVERRAFDLREAVFERVDALQEPERVQVDAGEDRVLVSDPQLFGIVLSNLLDNAAKYSPESSAVRVSIADQACDARPGVLLTVSNAVTPALMPDADALFGKYYRAPGARSKSGSGLGLHLSSAIAERLGGSLRFRAAAGRAEFLLWLPD